MYSKTGRKEDAYRAYEELLFSGYQHMQMTLNDLRSLYREDGDRGMVDKLDSVSSAAASVFEMGRYNEVCVGLDTAVWEKDAARTAQIMEKILDNLETLGDFAKSSLYQHMAFKPVGPEFVEGFRKELLRLLGDEKYSYMEESGYWERLKASVGKG